MTGKNLKAVLFISDFNQIIIQWRKQCQLFIEYLSKINSLFDTHRPIKKLKKGAEISHQTMDYTGFEKLY